MNCPVLPTIPYLSVSQIKTFLQCPRLYRFRYIDKLQPEFRSVALAFGTAWHAAVEHYLAKHAAAAAVSTEELVDVFRESLDHELADDAVPVLFDDDETDAGALVAKARDMLEAFVLQYPLPDRVLGIEQAFMLEIAHPVTGEVLGVPLVGAIDALVERDGKVLVVELKSSKRKWSADQLEQDLQGTAYRMAARSLGYADAEVELVVTTKSKKPDVQVERLVRHHGDEREFAELAADVVRAIEAGVDHRNRGWACRGCSHAGACGT